MEMKLQVTWCVLNQECVRERRSVGQGRRRRGHSTASSTGPGKSTNHLMLRLLLLVLSQKEIPQPPRRPDLEHWLSQP